MKTYSFDIFKCRVTITIEKRKYETIDRLETSKELVKSQPDEIKMEEALVYIPFGDYCASYIDSHAGDFAKSTLDGYRNILNNHLQSLMTCNALDVCEFVIQVAFDAEMEKGLSKKTLKGYWSFLKKVFAAHDRTDLCDLDIRFEKEKTE